MKSSRLRDFFDKHNVLACILLVLWTPLAIPLSIILAISFPMWRGVVGFWKEFSTHLSLEWKGLLRLPRLLVDTYIYRFTGRIPD
jgi:hypothetical protein